ncbi:MAG TPA: NAD-binding protein, partial [Candidatus Limnocylindrales bacterium]|nr:NAD-binding protein [Candidatus Limnocylindrales bacterium]
IRGDGTDEDVLRKAGVEGADVLLALTEGDNRNILAAQLAMESFGIPHVVAKINDPVRAEAYTQMGISTICRTTRLIDALGRFTGLPPEPGADGVHVAVPHRHDADGRARPADAMELDGRPGDDRRPEADGRTGAEDRTGAEGRSGEG